MCEINLRDYNYHYFFAIENIIFRYHNQSVNIPEII